MIYFAEGRTDMGRRYAVYASGMREALEELDRIAEKSLGEAPAWDEIKAERMRYKEMRQGRVSKE